MKLKKKKIEKNNHNNIIIINISENDQNIRKACNASTPNYTFIFEVTKNRVYSNKLQAKKSTLATPAPFCQCCDNFGAGNCTYTPT